MPNRFQPTTLLRSILSSLLFTLTLTTPIFAAPTNWSSTNSNVPATICDFEFVFSRAVTAAVALIGLAVLIMLIMGGFKLITSGGDAKASEQARSTMTLAIGGLALLVGSIFILKFIQFFTGVDILNFAVCK